MAHPAVRMVLLHSGARYAVDDQELAIECIDENMILRKIAPQMIEPNGGLFVGLDDSDMAYRERFIQGCQDCHIPIEELKPEMVLKMEPELTTKIHTAFSVPDGTFDPLRLALAFAASAKSLWSTISSFLRCDRIYFNGIGDVIRRQISGSKKWHFYGDICGFGCQCNRVMVW